MAKFNADIPVDTGNSFIHYSRGTGSYGEGLGKLFSGVGESMSLWAKNQDQQNQFNIQRTADSQINNYMTDAVQPQIGISGAAGIGVSGGSVPLPISQGATKMANIQQAQTEGKLSDLNAWTQASNIAKNLRTQYPNYGPEIDHAVSMGMRINPANRVREELNQQLAKEQAGGSSTMKFREEELKTAVNNGTLGQLGIDPSKINLADDSVWNKLYSAVSNFEGQKAASAASLSALTLKKANREDVSQDAYDQANKKLGFSADTFFNQSGNQFNKWFEDFKTQGKDGFSPDEITQLTQTFAQLQGQYELFLRNTLSLRDDKTGSAWTDLISPKQVDDLVSEQMGRFNTMKSLLFDQNFGAVSAAARETKLRIEGGQNEAMKKLYSGDPKLEILRLSKLYTEMGLPPQVSQYLLEGQFGNVGAWSNELKAGMATMTMGAVTGQVKDIGSVIKSLQDAGHQNGQWYQKAMQTYGKYLNDPSVTGEQAAVLISGLVKSNLDSGLLPLFGEGATRESVFKEISQPGLAQKLKGTGVFNDYGHWMQNNFVSLITPALRDIGGINLPTGIADTRFDDKSGHFLLDAHIPPRVAARGQPEYQGKVDKLQERLDFINTYADRLNEWAKASGDDGIQILKNLYSGAQVPESMMLPNNMIHGMLSTPDNTKPFGTTDNQPTSQNHAGFVIQNAPVQTASASPEGYINRLVQIESGGNPQAFNTKSGAAGLVQFVPGTARKYGLPRDARQASSAQQIAAAEALTNDNQTFLSEQLGRAPGPGELYLAHQQGARGALELLENPNEPAIDIVGKKAVLQNGGTADMTAKDFSNLWIKKFEQ